MYGKSEVVGPPFTRSEGPEISPERVKGRVPGSTSCLKHAIRNLFRIMSNVLEIIGRILNRYRVFFNKDPMLMEFWDEEYALKDLFYIIREGRPGNGENAA